MHVGQLLEMFSIDKSRQLYMAAFVKGVALPNPLQCTQADVSTGVSVYTYCQLPEEFQSQAERSRCIFMYNSALKVVGRQ